MNDITKLATYDASKKSYGLVYLLWIFLGWAGVHRLVVGDKAAALGWMLFTVVTIIDPSTFFKFYLCLSLIEWVAIGLRVKKINEDALWELKRPDAAQAL